MASCNASGALSYSYGSTRNWIERIRVVLADGDILSLRRGIDRANGRAFSLMTEGGRRIGGHLPSYAMPKVKSASGYYLVDDMDMLDLFIGMEGTLGVITEIELKLIPSPGGVVALVVFLPDEDAALEFVRALRLSISARPAAIEFFNYDALSLLRDARDRHSAFSTIPVLKSDLHTAIYTEFHSDNPDDLDDAVAEVMEAMISLGASDEDAWCATSDRELDALKGFRHATPEAVNLLIDERKRIVPGLTKLGTDMSVPDSQLNALMAMYRAGLEESGLESVIFGHIGDNHVHVNILPTSAEGYDRGMELYLSWAKWVVEVGGAVSAEHGIGKAKRSFLRLMYGEDAIAEMQALKRLFDPHGMLNPGNLF
jgi:D-lactate dehydrogenase (cytochrome)